MRPKIAIISASFAKKILTEAADILEKVGVFVENREAYALFMERGARPKSENADGIGKLLFPSPMVEWALQRAPKGIELFDVNNKRAASLRGQRSHFDPGSAALFLHDPAAGLFRRPVSDDLRKYITLVDKLPYYKLQSTALISSDVPEDCADSYRLYLALRYGRKPVVTGTFKKESFAVMRRMLETVRGGARNLKEKPLAIFDACPSPPLMWSDLTAQSVIDAARAGIPSEFVSMPLTGSTAPVTLSGAIVQHAAETLSGVVLAQCAAEGAPVIWGGSPAAMDLRFGTTPMGAIETMMIDLSYAAVGKSLGLPTHAYMGLSDSKQVDYQAGMESALGIVLAALGGINVISGAGMMDFESGQSLEKLVLDHEVCGMAYRLLDGVAQRDEVMALDLLAGLEPGGHLLTHPHTLKWFKKEILSPGKAIDRRARGAERLSDLKTADARAREEVERLTAEALPAYLSDEIGAELDKLMAGEIRRVGGRGNFLNH